MNKKLTFFLVVCAVFTFLGCASVQRSIDNYEACKADAVCAEKMQTVGSAAYVGVKSASSSLSLPSIPEVLAVVVSNILMFVYGVSHGKRKKVGAS